MAFWELLAKKRAYPVILHVVKEIYEVHEFSLALGSYRRAFVVAGK
jgi:hypothetical protein